MKRTAQKILSILLVMLSIPLLLWSIWALHPETLQEEQPQETEPSVTVQASNIETTQPPTTVPTTEPTTVLITAPTTVPESTTTKRPAKKPKPTKPVQKPEPPKTEPKLPNERQFLKVTAPYAETTYLSSKSDRSDPKTSPFLFGTCDEITGTAAFDKDAYFITKSGFYVKQDCCQTFRGEPLPPNTARAGLGRQNELAIALDRKVPFIGQVKPQKYYVGYLTKPYNIETFTGEYIDFVFYDTKTAKGDVTFLHHPIVSHAKWIEQNQENSTATLRVYFKQKGRFYGYHAYWAENGDLHIRFANPPSKTPRVLLDAGHGGKDCGAIGANGTHESQVVLYLAQKVRENLLVRGIQVEMTRTEDYFVTLDKRQQLARDTSADLVVAIHANAAPAKKDKSKWMGPEVYYYRGYSKKPAACIQKELISAWQDIYAHQAAMRANIVPNDGGVRFYPFQVTRIEEHPAILVECGYLSHPTECLALSKQENQNRLAKAIADGIVAYLRSEST